MRTISAVQTDSNDIFIASSSQDTRIRIWKISQADSKEKPENSTQVYMDKTHYFRYNQKIFCVFLESVLIGHEDWVLSVSWHPLLRNSERPNQNEHAKDSQKTRPFHQPLSLLSASMDRSMMIWKPEDLFGGIWTNEIHVGEVGGNTLGFFGGVFSPEGNAILANGYNGAFHLWKKEIGDQSEIKNTREQWISSYAMSGNFGPVVDVSWHSSGTYFATVR